MKNIPITEWCRGFIKEQVKPGDVCIDATMGNGHDTLLLSFLAGEEGLVYAFDIQKEALLHTQTLLEQEKAPRNYRLLLCSHTQMADYALVGTVSCIVFNFGYLPGGDHSKSTHASTSLQALELSLKLLKKGGLLSLCIYRGGDTGFEEQDAVLKWLKELDPKDYLVILSSYYNRPNYPPIPALVIKLC
ncbi:MAG: class I SAM-dependent methyltransferase [Eubacteriales bacterium]|nr:class I SAM-dependent methyltransferase [Eubacteriales bacterium]